MRHSKLAATTLATALTAGTVAFGTPAAADTTCAKTIVIGDAQASEGAGEIRFPVTMAAPVGCALAGSVGYSTTGLGFPNPADASDYTHVSGQLTWSPPSSGPGTRWIAVPLKQNTAAEKNETLGVSLSGASGATITDGLAVGTIVDDDPVATPIQPPTPLPDDDSTPRCVVKIPVELSAPAVTPIKVTWAIVEGTAKLGDDFGVTGGTSTILAGSSVGSIELSVYKNYVGEQQESFDIVVTGVSPGRLAPGTGTIHLVIPVGWGLP